MDASTPTDQDKLMTFAMRNGYKASLVQKWLPALDGGAATRVRHRAAETPFNLIFEVRR